MLGMDGQQRVREALRKVDKALTEQVHSEGEIAKHADTFRETFFNAFQLIEQETLTLQELNVQIRRPDKQQLQVQSQGRLPFVLLLNTEVGYDIKASMPPNDPEQSPDTLPSDLSARMFAVLAPPYRGLLRYYTIFADGMWKRTTFTFNGNVVAERSALVPRYNAEILTLEAVDLLSYACLAHPTWNPLISESETVTAEALRDRNTNKIHSSGLGNPRR